MLRHIYVTAENLAEARDACIAIDQRDALTVGCETWTITYGGGQVGQMTVWHNESRGAVCWGGDSQWGDWDEDSRTLYLEDGTKVDEGGNEVLPQW